MSDLSSDPVCEKCGAPIETGAMALLCPARVECAMWPAEGVDGVLAEMFPDTWTPVQKQAFREHCERRAR